MDKFIKDFLYEVSDVSNFLDYKMILKIILSLKKKKKNKGRIFFIGVGGSAGNASHAVNDFRKICDIECYSPTDNVSELTARTNDEGWKSVFYEWLKVSNLNAKDLVFVFSVGGGNSEKNISANIVEALKYGKSVGSKIVGIVGRDGGYTVKVADAFCLIML